MNVNREPIIRRIVGWLLVSPKGTAMLLSPTEAEARYGASLYGNGRPTEINPIFEGDEAASGPIFKSRPFARDGADKLLAV